MANASGILLFSAIEFVLLDRDGVINRKAPEGEYIHNWRDFQFLADVETAIGALCHTGKRVIILTNQRGIALGLYTRTDVEVLHNQLQRRLANSGAYIDAFYICPHDKNECDCRKPKTGLLEQAFRDFPNATKTNTLLVGDSLSDIQAARSFGIPSLLIRSNAENARDDPAEAASLATAISPSLIDAVRKYLI